MEQPVAAPAAAAVTPPSATAALFAECDVNRDGAQRWADRLKHSAHGIDQNNVTVCCVLFYFGTNII